MRRYSPPNHSPPRRGYGGRGRSPPRRGSSGQGRRREQGHGSLLVRNIPLDCRSEELRIPFERFGVVRDVYLPKDYYTGGPRGFAFVEFVDPEEALEAQYHMNGQKFAGREISVVVASETRKRPDDMRHRTRSSRGLQGNGGRRSSHYGRSRSRSLSRSRSPRRQSGSRSRMRSISRSRSPRRPSGSRNGMGSRTYSVSPGRRHPDRPRSPRGPPSPRETDGHHNRGPSYSPANGNAAGHDQNANDYRDKKSAYEAEDGRPKWRSSPGRGSRSPSGSRSRSADLSPRRGR